MCVKIVIYSNDPLCRYLANFNQLFSINNDKLNNLQLIEIKVVDYMYFLSNEIEIYQYINSSQYGVIIYNCSLENSSELLRIFYLGCKGVVGKEHLFTEISQAIQSIITGKIYYPEKLSKEIVRTKNGAYKLTPKELMVKDLLKKGYSYKSIAYDMELSINTVKCYITSLYRKLNIHSRVELLI